MADSARPKGKSAKCHEPMTQKIKTAGAASAAKAPLDALEARPKAAASNTLTIAQPISADAWFKNVADGGKFKASSEGRATAPTIAAISDKL